VRHTTAGNNWGPYRDQLRGTETLGTVGGDGGGMWTVPFEAAVPGYTKFLFATGDCAKWLVSTKDSAIGGYYANSPRPIIASSSSSSSYSARWYRRQGNAEDPWISINDHGPAIPGGNILVNNHHSYLFTGLTSPLPFCPAFPVRRSRLRWSARQQGTPRERWRRRGEWFTADSRSVQVLSNALAVCVQYIRV
jgi:hypothetical protein